jgi:citrate synthase
MMETLVSAREAAGRLGIKLDTLYAYVSRGLLRSVEVAGSRERYYRDEDIERLRAGRGARGKRVPMAETLVPVIGSAICLIEDGRFYYRGEDAIRLAERASLEEVAALLWEVPPRPAAPRADPSVSPQAGREVETAPHSPASPCAVGEGEFGLIERCQVRLAALSSQDPLALDLSRAGVVRTGQAILGELAAVVAGKAAGAAPVHELMAEAWRLDAKGADVVRRCLVLLADHELNASTFVARCVASTGATPYAAVSAALSALSGRRHGGASARAEALFQEIGAGDPMAVLAARLARGDDLPGLGQPLYPKGDPRAVAIVEAIAAASPAAGRRIAAAAVAAMQLTGRYPNVDFALGAAATALGLPPGSAVCLFLVARSVGWIAHALEQYESGMLIRPRARYAGKRPLHTI